MRFGDRIAFNGLFCNRLLQHVTPQPFPLRRRYLYSDTLLFLVLLLARFLVLGHLLVVIYFSLLLFPIFFLLDGLLIILLLLVHQSAKGPDALT